MKPFKKFVRWWKYGGSEIPDALTFLGMAFLVLAMNLVLLAGAVWVVVKVLQVMGVL